MKKMFAVARQVLKAGGCKSVLETGRLGVTQRCDLNERENESKIFHQSGVTLFFLQRWVN